VSFSVLALVVAVGLLGPLLAAKGSWNVPVVIGELVGGALIGASGFHLVDTTDAAFSLLANIGFGLIMFVVGSRVPVRDGLERQTIVRSAVGAVLVGVLAAILGVALSLAFGTDHAALYGVLIASSSAALILPIIGSLQLTGQPVLQLTAQVAIADTVCIVVLPLAIDPSRAGPAAIGALAIALCAVLLFFVLRALERRELLSRLHEYSEERRFALELRFSLLMLFLLASLAEFTGLSILLAGFALGLVIGAIGEPHRLARQLFGITEGFFGPLFFVWLGASVGLSDLGRHPQMVLLGICLGLAGIVAHLASRAVGLPWLLAAMSAGQLGVPIAAATLGRQLNLLAPGEDAALLLGALITIGVTSVASSLHARRAAGVVRES
jgi:Kef-type K+ transport system membrane component KefB